MEFINEETIEDIIKDMEDHVSKMQNCIETLKNGSALDDVQIRFVKTTGIEI